MTNGAEMDANMGELIDPLPQPIAFSDDTLLQITEFQAKTLLPFTGKLATLDIATVKDERRIPIMALVYNLQALMNGGAQP